MRKTLLTASILAATLVIGGCANKAQTGTALGAGVGGIACGMLTKNSTSMTRLVATAGCATVGGYIGNRIGRSLDARDQEALAATTQRALNGSQAGTYEWNSAHSGATASIKVSEPYQKTGQVSVKRAEGVQPVARIEKLDGQYLTVKGANVRKAPSTNAEKVGFMPELTQFNAMGKTGDWILVGRKGVAVGYVYAPLVKNKAAYEKELAAKAKPATTVAKAADKPAAAAVVAAPVVVPAVVLDTASAATVPELGKLTEVPTVKETPVTEVQTCRSIESLVKDGKGKTESATSNSCKKADEDIWADA